MSDESDKALWYVAGLGFACARCGRCCAGPEEGYVWATADEIAAIANHLGITPEQMQQTYARRVGGRVSLRERGDNNDCVFLSANGGQGRGCMIYPVRPTQCRTWPFWPVNLRNPETWAQAGARCPGVNHGDRVNFDDIQTRRNATGR